MSHVTDTSSENTPFVAGKHQDDSEDVVIPEQYVSRILPFALAAAMAIAATSATNVYAYADILCVDPAHCKEEEKTVYAGAVAIATTIANTCGIMALGPLQSFIKTRPRGGLLFWLCSRATSVAVLFIAVLCKDIRIAFIGRIFEGFATDNLLHFNLNAIYVSVHDQNRISRLMGTSLGLYMIGMSFSPTAAGLFPNFLTSFIMALAIFGISIFYLLVFVPTAKFRTTKLVFQTPDCASSDHEATSKASSLTPFHLRSLFRPIVSLYDDPVIILPAIALLLYNAAQAYLFPAIMVYTALRFSFTGRENGFIISIAAGTSATYLFGVFYLVPRIKMWLSKARRGDEETDRDEQESNRSRLSTSDFAYGTLSMAIQLSVLPCIPATGVGWQIFPLVTLIALGLAAPSFLKSYGLSLAKEKSQANASFAMMESVGGILSAVVLGSWQSWKGEGSVFFVASGLVAGALVAILGSVCFTLRASK